MRSLGSLIPSHLRQRVATLRTLDELLADCLPTDCRSHCRAGGITDGSLVLVCDSPAWRSRIHFYSDHILKHFNRLDNISISRVKVRVGRPEAPQRPPPQRPAGGRPPAATARALDELADDTEDPALADTLRRLARHGR